MTYRMTLLLVALGLAAIACEKPIQLAGTSAVVKSITLHYGKTLTAEKDYVVAFKEASQMTIQLDINNCFTRYTVPTSDRINIGPAACTKACCDSEFATRMVALFPSIFYYKLKNDELILTGENPNVRMVLQMKSE